MIAAFMVPQKRDFISRDDAKIAAWTILEGMGVSAKHNERLAEEVDAVVDDIPAADVRPVVRGSWMKRRFSENCVGYECLNCYTTWDAPTNFCPNCGADMRNLQSDSANANNSELIANKGLEDVPIEYYENGGK